MSFGDEIASVDRAVQDFLGGVAVIYAPKVGKPHPIVGMFDDNFVLVERGEGGVESVGPAVVVRLEDLPTDPEVDDPIITIGHKRYTVSGRNTDGTVGGQIRLILREAAS